MANPDAPFGLRPIRHITGAPWNGATIRCVVNTLLADALYIGDAVDINSDLSDRATTERYLSVMIAGLADTNLILGVITSFDPLPANLTQQYNPASPGADRYCQVCVDPTVVYEIRGDAAAAGTNVMVGQNATGITTHEGSTITGLSGMELAEGSGSANASYPFLIVGISDRADNEFDGSTDTRVIYEVLISTSRLGHSGGADGLGILGVTAA